MEAVLEAGSRWLETPAERAALAGSRGRRSGRLAFVPS